MVIKTNKRVHSSISSSSDSSSPFSHITPLPSIRIPHLDQQFHHQMDNHRQKKSSDFESSPPFTKHPLPYPPPGAILTPTSATYPSFNHSQPFSQVQPYTQMQSQPQPQQREIKFIYETGRKEPKSRKTTKPKEVNQKVENNGRKVLGNKGVKDPNVSRKPKPSPLNLKITSKLPLIDTDQASHIPSPPPTACRFHYQALPKVSGMQQSHYPLPRQGHTTTNGNSHVHGTPHNDFRVSMQPFAFSLPTYQSPPETRTHTLPSIDSFHSMNMVDGNGSAEPLPIDAPVPGAPQKTCTPFFEDDLCFPDNDHDDELDGHHEMEVDFGYSPQDTGLGLGLDLGISNNGNREMMDFVPRKPSLDIMMDNDVGYSSHVDNGVDHRSTRFGTGLMGLGLLN